MIREIALLALASLGALTLLAIGTAVLIGALIGDRDVTPTLERELARALRRNEQLRAKLEGGGE